MDETRGVPLGRHVAFWSLALAGCAIDLAVKRWMFDQPDLRAGGVKWVWPEHAGFQLSLNEGALFGMGQGRVWIFAVCACVAAAAIPVWLFVFRAARDRALTLVMACILGGVLGNLYDRLGLPGLDWGLFDPDRAGEPVHAVRDFVLLAWRWSGDWRQRVVWPNFNVADSLLVCGALSLVLLSFRRRPESPVAVSAKSA